jgi:hypothetical protein
VSFDNHLPALDGTAEDRGSTPMLETNISGAHRLRAASRNQHLHVEAGEEARYDEISHSGTDQRTNCGDRLAFEQNTADPEAGTVGNCAGNLNEGRYLCHSVAPAKRVGGLR